MKNKKNAEAKKEKKISKSVVIGVLCSFFILLSGGLFFAFRTDRYTKGIEIKKRDGEYVVTSVCSAKSKDIVLPKWYKGHKVTAIGERAFYGSDITSVTIPNSISKIEKEAFANCYSLNNIVYNGKKREVMFNNGFACNGIKFEQDAFKDTCKDYLKFDIADSSDGDTTTTINISNIPQNVTKIKIIAGLVSRTDMVVTTEFDTTGQAEVNGNIDFGSYGYFKDIEIELYSGEEKVDDICAEGVAITSPHYNIAYLNGTYPVLVYSLKLHEIAAEHPTFTFLERTKAYNYSKLPYNVIKFPFMTKEESEEEFTFHEHRSRTAEYIKSLYELDNNATFTFYGVDNYPELMLEFFVANKIPESNWNACMLSDGLGTAKYLNDAFAVENPQEKYSQMKKNWEDVKNYVYEHGYNSTKIYKMLDYKWESKYYHLLVYYTYVVAKEQSNVEWWVNRLRTGENLSGITAKNAEFAQSIVDVAKSFYTNNLLSALDEAQKQTFKELYHFNDEMFDVARSQDKKIMVILGTSYINEGEKLYDYMKLTMELYGDEYVYYYKGHPGFPTSLIPPRQRQFEALIKEGYEFYELDNAIAAEVIMYFNPDVYLSGWSSSTYDSVEDHNMLCVVFDFDFTNKDGAIYGDMIDIFATPIGDRELSGVSFDTSHKIYLLEYNNTAGYQNQEQEYAKHEIAIYDATKHEITYYKWNSVFGKYLEVEK